VTKIPLLRVGRIPYANLHPIFHVLAARFPQEGVRFVEGTPAALNRRLRAGRLDVSPSSSIEYAKHPDRYLLCPDISISSRRKVMSVVLLSRDPLRALPDGPIAVPASSDTSVVLLEILLRESLGKRNRLVRTTSPPHAALRRFPAVLSIGDEAIRAVLDGAAPHMTDLGAWWRRETGFSFVFALWIVSAGSMPAKGEAVRRFARTLLAAKREAKAAIRVATPADIGPAWIPPAFRTAYWRNLSYDLGREEEGLLLFFRLARKIGRIPAVPSLRFLDLQPGRSLFPAGTTPLIL
jgi:chorismate dehydratase